MKKLVLELEIIVKFLDSNANHGIILFFSCAAFVNIARRRKNKKLSTVLYYFKLCSLEFIFDQYAMSMILHDSL